MLQKLEFDLKDCHSFKEGMVTIHQEGNTIYTMSVPEHAFWQEHCSEKDKGKSFCVDYFEEVEPGIYYCALNFEHDIRSFTGFNAYQTYDNIGKDGIPMTYKPGDNMNDYFENSISTYGVADNIEQIKERYKSQIESDNPVVIGVTVMSKEHQPEDGGWRWHKWGQYIGTQDPQCEYLYDEPEIKEVLVFHIFAVKPKEQLNNTMPKKNKIN